MPRIKTAGSAGAHIPMPGEAATDDAEIGVATQKERIDAGIRVFDQSADQFAEPAHWRLARCILFSPANCGVPREFPPIFGSVYFHSYKV
ncbi:MAG: hypothetical protein ABI082_13510 [Dokdonella sp.]